MAMSIKEGEVAEALVTAMVGGGGAAAVVGGGRVIGRGGGFDGGLF